METTEIVSREKLLKAIQLGRSGSEPQYKKAFK
jgi:hypothetical protein